MYFNRKKVIGSFVFALILAIHFAMNRYSEILVESL